MKPIGEVLFRPCESRLILLKDVFLTFQPRYTTSSTSDIHYFTQLHDDGSYGCSYTHSVHICTVKMCSGKWKYSCYSDLEAQSNTRPVILSIQIIWRWVFFFSFFFANLNFSKEIIENYTISVITVFFKISFELESTYPAEKLLLLAWLVAPVSDISTVHNFMKVVIHFTIALSGFC